MGRLDHGRYRARFAECDGDVRAAQALRYRAFIAETGAAPRPDGREADGFDTLCRHVLVEDTESDVLVCCFRVLPLGGGAEIATSYSAQYYGLTGLETYDGPLLEMGRFCIEPGRFDPEIVRVAWGALAKLVEDEGVEMLIGCSSFRGTDAASYHDAFAVLKERHLGPKRWLPKVKAPNVFRFARRLRRKPDLRRALLTMPPLLRSYLSMGGWVSDHAVVDRDLGTLHVFTGLEIASIPPARKRLLQAAAG